MSTATAAGIRERQRRRRRWLEVGLVGLCAAAGALSGAAAGWSLILRLTGERLAAYSGLLLEQAGELDDEARHTLAQFDAQPDRFCSAGEFEQLREVVYRTHYVKDVGRIRDGQLVCSAALQAIEPPHPLPAAQIVTADGIGVSAAELLLLARGSRAPVLVSAATRVVLDTEAFHVVPFPDVHSVIGYVAANDGGFLPLYGRPLDLGKDEWKRQAMVDRDGLLARPACLAARALCVATSERKTELFADQWPLLLVLTALGAVSAAAVAWLALLWRQRGRRLEARLRRAIARDELEVEYQPIVRVADGAVVGAEALVRWREGEGALVPPSRFIPIAEADGSINRITLLVIRHVLRDLAPLLRGDDGFQVNVNISANDLDNGRFHEAMAEALRAAGVAPRRLGIELTEHSTAARDIAVAGTRRLRELGHGVYIDDFGTGYSSLAYLGQLAIDGIKVDRSFTATIGTDALQVSLLPQIVAMARALGLSVVIEGVESESQVAYLGRFDYPVLAQGWLFGRPMSAAALRARIAAAGAG